MCPPVIRRLGSFILALVLLGSLAVSQALAASITVNSLADVAANDGACTLREAITAANTDTASGAAAGECAGGSGPDNISFSVTGPITLSSNLPSITGDVGINGGRAITIDGASAHHIFLIAPGTSASLTGLTLTHSFSAGDGGAIINSGDLQVVEVVVTANNATQDGGAISNSDIGRLDIQLSTISGNTGGSTAGGIDNEGTLTVINSTISGNSAPGGGGGIVNRGTATVANVTFSGNTSGFRGGAIFNAASGTLDPTNVTISGNTATSDGGGIYEVNGGTTTLVGSLVLGNSAPTGPDVVFGAGSPAPVTSIIGVPLGKTLADILVPAGLADNGGESQTIALALVAGNPAIDGIASPDCIASPVNGIDQRFMDRFAPCDIGAYEAQPPTVAAHANVAVAVSPPAPTSVTYTLPTAADEQGGVLAVNCVPPSGSTFAVGTTTVTCTATDAVGHRASGTFNVVLSAVAPPSPPAPSLPNGAAAIGPTGAPSSQTALGWLLVAIGLFSLSGLLVLGRATGRNREGPS